MISSSGGLMIYLVDTCLILYFFTFIDIYLPRNTELIHSSLKNFALSSIIYCPGDNC